MNESITSNAALQSMLCATLTLCPKAEWESMGTTWVIGETSNSYVQCHNQCVLKTEQDAPCNKSVQVNSHWASTLFTTEGARRKKKETELKSRILRLQQSVNKYTDELKQLTTVYILHACHNGSSREPELDFRLEQQCLFKTLTMVPGIAHCIYSCFCLFFVPPRFHCFKLSNDGITWHSSFSGSCFFSATYVIR